MLSFTIQVTWESYIEKTRISNVYVVKKIQKQTKFLARNTTPIAFQIEELKVQPLNSKKPSKIHHIIDMILFSNDKRFLWKYYTYS